MKTWYCSCNPQPYFIKAPGTDEKVHFNGTVFSEQPEIKGFVNLGLDSNEGDIILDIPQVSQCELQGRSRIDSGGYEIVEPMANNEGYKNGEHCPEGNKNFDQSDNLNNVSRQSKNSFLHGMFQRQSHSHALSSSSLLPNNLNNNIAFPLSVQSVSSDGTHDISSKVEHSTSRCTKISHAEFEHSAVQSGSRLSDSELLSLRHKNDCNNKEKFVTNDGRSKSDVYPTSITSQDACSSIVTSHHSFLHAPKPLSIGSGPAVKIEHGDINNSSESTTQLPVSSPKCSSPNNSNKIRYSYKSDKSDTLTNITSAPSFLHSSATSLSESSSQSESIISGESSFILTASTNNDSFSRNSCLSNESTAISSCSLSFLDDLSPSCLLDEQKVADSRSEDGSDSFASSISRNRFQSRFFSDEPLYQVRAQVTVLSTAISDSLDTRCSLLMRSVEDEDSAICCSDPGTTEFSNVCSTGEQVYDSLSACIGSPPENPTNVDVGDLEYVERKYNRGIIRKKSLWCEADEVIASGILSTVSSTERKVQEVMFELLSSEASYVKSLNVYIDIFVQSPFFKHDNPLCVFPSVRDKTDLFSNVIAVRHVAESFLQRLEERWQENVLMDTICDIICEFSENRFHVYCTYCSNMAYQERRLATLIKIPKFDEVIRTLQTAPECQSLPLSSFMVLPMQRITRLKLLVNTLVSRLTPNTERYKLALRSEELLNKVVHECNEEKGKMDRLEELASISNILIFKDKTFPLVSQNRQLLKRGELKEIIRDDKSGHKSLGKRSFGNLYALLKNLRMKPLYLLLFNDVFLVTKRKRKAGEEKLEVLHWATRNMLMVEETSLVYEENISPSSPPASDNRNHLIRIVILENQECKHVEFFLTAPSLSEHRRWLNVLLPPTKSENESIYASWDCPRYVVIKSYKAQQADEIGLEMDEFVDVLKKIPDGWFEGERVADGKKGWFPSEYVMECQSDHSRVKDMKTEWRLKQTISAQSQQVKAKKNKNKDFNKLRDSSSSTITGGLSTGASLSTQESMDNYQDFSYHCSFDEPIYVDPDLALQFETAS